MGFISPRPLGSARMRSSLPSNALLQFKLQHRGICTRRVTFACAPTQHAANLKSALVPIEHELDSPFTTNWEDENWGPLSVTQLQALQRQIPTHFYQLKNLRTALIDDDSPPSSAEIRAVVHQVNTAALRLQAHTKRALPGYREFTEVLATLDAPNYHPHFLAYRMSLDGAIGDMFYNMSMLTAALVRHSQLEVAVNFDDYLPRDIIDTMNRMDRYTDVQIPGVWRLCNRYWLCVSWDALRAHRLFRYLPEVGSTQVEDAESLSRLRQDSEAFGAARSAVPLHACSMWRILGFGEEEAGCKFGEWLPGECVGHGHVLAGWRALVGGGEEEGDGFERQFGHLHVPNAVISYLEAMQEWFKGVGIVSYAPAVRVFEGGLYVTEVEGFGVVGCSAVGRVLRRREEDFWSWAGKADGCLIGKTERVYKRRGKDAIFRVVKARSKLDVVSFVEAQITMLVHGEDVDWVDVVWHGVLGGMRTFRVWRDEVFIGLAGEFVGEFRKKYAGRAPRPPPAGFQRGALFEKLAERAVMGCEKAEVVFEVDRVVDELRVGLWRRRGTPDKFRKSNSRAFLRDYGRDDELAA